MTTVTTQVPPRHAPEAPRRNWVDPVGAAALLVTIVVLAAVMVLLLRPTAAPPIARTATDVSIARVSTSVDVHHPVDRHDDGAMQNLDDWAQTR
jgi:hypothetical protein